MTKSGKRLYEVTDKLMHLFAWLSAGIVLFNLVLLCANVFMRYVFNSPIKGTSEIVTMMMAWVAYSGMAYTMLNGKHMQLEALTEKRGEIWAKLDAGSERWFQKIDRSRISLEQIQKNLESAVQKFPLRIQTMLCKIQNEFPDEEEIRLYIQRLQKIYVQNPSNFLGVQLYGVIRRTAIPEVLPLEKEFFEMVAQKIRETIPVHVAIF